MSWHAIVEMWHALWWWFVPCFLALEAIIIILIGDHIFADDESPWT